MKFGLKRGFLIASLIFSHFSLVGQTPDSLYHQLPEAEVRSNSSSRKLRLLSSENWLDTNLIHSYPPVSVVSAVNSVPGVRMEERSPGSYRLSVRGSLLRSPFGIRNVKIYLSDFPFTDAGGNTYLNSLDFSNVHSIRILKGPESSIFGANTGGILLIDPIPYPKDSLTAKATLIAGSYGLFQENTVFQKRWKKSEFSFVQAYQRSDGYRKNSGLEKHFVQLSQKWNYLPKASIKFLLLFSDLFYQTPGGLTLAQFEADPSAARFPTATLPGAETQKAAIYNRSIFGGISNEFKYTSRLKQVISIFGSRTDFKNPFITNYEERKENTAGARTYLDWSVGKSRLLTAKLNLGAEWQQTNARIENFGNNQGNKTAMFASDHVNARQGFVFSRILIDVAERLLLETSLSYNVFGYSYKRNFPLQENIFSKRNFNPQLMPGVATSFVITKQFAWRAAVRGGYSAPTIAEVRSSDNVINTSLEAENGISYETGFRFNSKSGFLSMDACVFYFELQNAIVRRMNADGTEFFINAGGTSQPGLEGEIKMNLIKPRKEKIIRSLKISGNLVYNRFTFTNYLIGETDYSGQHVTGVPRFTSAESISVDFPFQISFFTQYYYASEIPLNDANAVYADAYHLIQFKLEWRKTIAKLDFSFFAGIDNLLNQKYSLGNDLNAAGNRYYNAASPRNGYGGIRCGLK